MPAATTLSTNVAGTFTHLADTNTVHGVINGIQLATVVTEKVGAYTLVQADSGSIIPVNSGSSVAISVSGTGMAVGSSIELLRKGTGAVTLTAINGAVLTGPSATLTPRVQWSTISLLWLSATSVLVGGDLT